jgi:hypothetical protein
MHPPFRRFQRLISLVGIAALATGFCVVSPAVTSAHTKKHAKAALESGVSEESTTGKLEEPKSESPPTTSTNTPTTSGSETPPTESPITTRSEERHGHHRDAVALAGCSVSLEASASKVAPGASLDFTGTLSCPEGTNAAEQTVTLYRRVAGTSGFSELATTTTEASGQFRFEQSGPELNGTFYVRADGARSARVKVKVGPQVDLEAPTAGTQLPAGPADAASAGASGNRTVTFSGTVTPAIAGTTIALQRELNGGGWCRIGHGQVNAEGRYSIARTFFKHGQITLRVVAYSPGLKASVSAPVAYQLTSVNAGADVTSSG